MRFISGCSLLVAALVFGIVSDTTGATRSIGNYEHFEVGALAPWMIRYPDEKKPRLRINTLMADLKLSRLQAVEMQNHFLDGFSTKLTEDEVQELLESSYARALNGEFESQVDLVSLQAAPFIVVFDLDATLYDQSLPANSACADITYARPSGADKVIMLAPGWEATFDRILKLKGKIVLFTAGPDDETLTNLSHWNWDGTPLYDPATQMMHPKLSGILTNHHLVRQAADEAEGATERRRGSVISEPSKDLRLLDETLKRVVIIDDNPARLIQLQHSRVVEKFRGSSYCALQSKSDKLSELTLARFDSTLSQVSNEIGKAAKRLGKYDFAQAFLPYSYFGAMTLRSFAEADSTLSSKDLEDLIVENPSLVRDRY